MKEKDALIQHLLSTHLESVSRLQHQHSELEESRNSESKSTAGDKHEVGRAMAQNELDNLGKRLAEQKERVNAIRNLSLEPSLEVKAGSLVETNSGIYFLAVGIGKVEMEGKTYFVVSPISPIGQAMLGKEVGDSIAFRERDIAVITIS